MAIQAEDEEILSKFRDEKTRNEAFNLLLKKYQQKIYWHVRRMVIDHDDADDIVQDVFIKIWKNLPGFRNDAQLYTWMYRIATNECITFLNKKKAKNNISLDDVDFELADTLSSSDQFTGDQIQRKLQDAILTLPDKQRLVFNMKYFDDMKYEEMSEVLGTSVGALKASYHLAVKKIEAFVTNID
ncbi:MULTISPECIES: sigma-70 family RNA polymerase sigma factor [unclassified Mucilaginibacter]|uniref:RNA polymerase sigma factor n=1 Tax=unclassified Mucilaginibacter TaxID=2617802 RepID=UPI002AC89774|nr:MULTISPECIES: sigma-70 family RNA polymerase sigma factor [unclassified Mucilaginibacter]MEB0261288.1 sigma-70 family RNA polymerase sigma factor [Mucilaginibacter sp. 10I4]MEB0280449.1 sigma-70 family RNA polymerase sigma factor [Mucilaginibacter sp. 10B2]MEB0300441.1 sigma-70 family RNA polymerase sigma factor [Mucilaginibacter sp. 5C4]WPX23124.1 sigma-70 family RNA polymerase sigma factor [Mucilaginibacter sp. 5C4]